MRRRKRRKIKRGAVCVLALLVLSAVTLSAAQFYRVFMEYAINLAEDSAQQEISGIVQELLEQEPETYASLAILERDSENRVTALRTDTVAIGRLKSRVITELFDRLSDLEHTTVEVPLGSVFAPHFFSGAGPSVDVGFVGMGQMSAEFISAFTAAGINQTRHNILIEIHAGIRILTPFGGNDREIISTFPLTDTVIVGTVPEQYLTIDSAGDGFLGKIQDNS